MFLYLYLKTTIPRQPRRFLYPSSMKILLTLSLLVTALTGVAQRDYDPRLLAKFSEERIRELQRDQPQIIDYWTYYLDESYSIVALTDGKILKSEKTLRIKDFENLNILELNVHQDRSQSKAYKIRGTGEYLVLMSNDAFTAKYNKSRGLKKPGKSGGER